MLPPWAKLQAMLQGIPHFWVLVLGVLSWAFCPGRFVVRFSFLGVLFLVPGLLFLGVLFLALVLGVLVPGVSRS